MLRFAVFAVHSRQRSTRHWPYGTPQEISQLACLGTQMPRNNILFASFPRELFKSAEVYDPVLEQDAFIWDADFDILRSYVSGFQSGTWPFSSPAEAPQSETSSCQ